MPSSLRCLIVEDNNINQIVLSAILKKLGHKSDVVSNGKEALGIVKHISYDLILMDINMPEMNGIECTRKIRSNNEHDPNPVFIIGISVDPECEMDSIEAGMNLFLSKLECFENIKQAIDPLLETMLSA